MRRPGSKDGRNVETPMPFLYPKSTLLLTLNLGVQEALIFFIMDRTKVSSISGFFTLFATLLLFSLSFVFLSCESDHDEEFAEGQNENTLISTLQGEWDFYSGTSTFMSMTVTMDNSTLDEMQSMLGPEFNVWDVTLKFSKNQVNGVNYTLNKSQIILEDMEMEEDVAFTINY